LRLITKEVSLNFVLSKLFTHLARICVQCAPYRQSVAVRHSPALFSANKGARQDFRLDGSKL